MFYFCGVGFKKFFLFLLKKFLNSYFTNSKGEPMFYMVFINISNFNLIFLSIAFTNYSLSIIFIIMVI